MTTIKMKDGVLLVGDTKFDVEMTAKLVKIGCNIIEIEVIEFLKKKHDAYFKTCDRVVIQKGTPYAITPDNGLGGLYPTQEKASSHPC